MRFIDYTSIISLAWTSFGSSRVIEKVEDISAKVSTNHVFKVNFKNGQFIIAKLSHFGRHDYFEEDHIIINSLANNLLFPYDHFIAKSLLKKNQVFTYRYNRSGVDVWLVFYNPIRVTHSLPKILGEHEIIKCGQQLGLFHKASSDVLDELPESSKSMISDIEDLRKELDNPEKLQYNEGQREFLQEQCDILLKNLKQYNYQTIKRIPVFVDWNIGNFSIDDDGNFNGRWDYDWFRISPRMMDFYFWSRVCRAEGDQTVFSYTIDTFIEKRFQLFLKEYHQVYPLDSNEIYLIPECYRFFILHYVIHLGQYFFLPHYADRLKKESLDTYLNSVEKFPIELLHEAIL